MYQAMQYLFILMIFTLNDYGNYLLSVWQNKNILLGVHSIILSRNFCNCENRKNVIE